jgi:major membrane immunogen (membrane-anchored lipoprotein)
MMMERKKRKYYCYAVFVLLTVALLLSACGKAAYRDGSYTGSSGADDTGAYGTVTITIGGGKITACEYVTWQKDGTIKDENYGKVNGEISNQTYYDKAQLAVAAMEQYAAQYLETQDLQKLDAVSGATIAYNQFIESVDDALEKARQR